MELESWNVTFTSDTVKAFYDYMHTLYPDTYSRGCSIMWTFGYKSETMVVKLSKEDAIILKIATGVIIERIEE